MTPAKLAGVTGKTRTKRHSLAFARHTPIGADSTGAAGECPGDIPPLDPVPAAQPGQKYHFSPVLFRHDYNFNTLSYTKNGENCCVFTTKNSPKCFCGGNLPRIPLEEFTRTPSCQPGRETRSPYFSTPPRRLGVSISGVFGNGVFGTLTLDASTRCPRLLIVKSRRLYGPHVRASPATRYSSLFVK